MIVDTTERFDAGNCLWDETAIAHDRYDSLDEDISCDVLIIGGGLTGIRTALGLAEQAVDTVLIDARHIGWGASGRSGGQCNPVWRMTPDELRKRLGHTIADNLIATTIDSANALFTDISRYGIDCDPVQAGWMQTAHGPRAEQSLLELHETWLAEGARIDVVDADGVNAATGAHGYRMGLFHSTGGHVHPLSMTRGFAACASRAGCRFYDNTAAHSIKRSQGRWQVNTARSLINCDRLVVATNAYSSDLVPDLHKSILPMVTVVVATEPMSADVANVVLPDSVTLSDTRRAILYGRRDRHDRLIFGCMGSSETMQQLGGLRRLTKGLRTVFPALANTKLTHQWAGRIALAPDLMPHLHEPMTGVTAALGYSGRGIANTSVMAKAIVSRMMGASEKELPFPITQVEKIPMHNVCLSLLPMMPPLLAIRDRLDTLQWARR